MPDNISSASSASAILSVESRASWVAAGVALAILSVAYGSTLLIVVGLRVMERDLGVSRSTLALAGAMTWVGTGVTGADPRAIRLSLRPDGRDLEAAGC